MHLKKLVHNDIKIFVFYSWFIFLLIVYWLAQ
jgi:hypothetical protein